MTGFELTVTAGTSVTSFTHDAGYIQSIEVELKTDGKQISTLTARLSDPAWKVFNALPDPAFHKVAVKLAITKPGERQGRVVFEGKATSYRASFPGPETLTLVAHDESVDIRRNKRARVFKGKTSKAIAEAIARDYGFTVDADLGDVNLKAPTISYAPGLSDWDHLRVALAADGLRCYVESKKLYIRQVANQVFPLKFTRGEPPIVRFEVDVKHVGLNTTNVKQKVPSADGKIVKDALASKATEKNEAAAANATHETHRAPVGGPSSTSKAHAEDKDAVTHANQVTGKRKRKDAASLTLQCTPEINARHILQLDGFGPRADGRWYVETVKHTLIPASDATSTSVSLTREPNDKAQSQAGKPLVSAAPLVSGR